MFLSKFRANFREYAVLRSGVIPPGSAEETESYSGAGPAQTQTAGVFAFSRR